jgi:spermidine synthase
MIGEGGGTIITALQNMLPDTRIDLVEIDGAVDRVAKQYFEFNPGPNTHVTIEDGRVYVRRVAAEHPNYDIVMLDAFDADYIPEHMLTKEFLEEVKSIMAPDGVIVANTFSSSALYDPESATYKTVFGTFYNLKLGNRIIAAKLDGLPPIDQIHANADKWEPKFQEYGTSESFILPLISTNVDWDTNARMLTDQYSPSNVLNAMGRSYNQNKE